MPAFYNDNDPKVCAWVRELIAGGHVMDGVVDERSCLEVEAADVAGFQRAHWFCGIAGWDYALQLAGWGDEPVWTASLPCQPFSAAGKRRGVADERHLWPAWFGLVRELRPGTIFGEQVASAIGHGWLDGVFADLEGEGYACGAVVLGAHSVGAPHIRQRLFWVAERLGDSVSDDVGRKRGGTSGAEAEGDSERSSDGAGGELSGSAGATSGVADAGGEERRGGADLHLRSGGQGEAAAVDVGAAGGVAESQGQQPHGVRDSGRGRGQPTDGRRLGHPDEPGSQGRGLRPDGDPGQRTPRSAEPTFIQCADGKARRAEPGIFPLVDGATRFLVPSGYPSVDEAQSTALARAMRLKGYGNCIVPQVAAEFVMAFMETR